MSLAAVRVITKAAELPLSLAEAKQHLRITHKMDDSYISAMIAAATDWAQTYTRRIFINTQVELAFDSFPDSCHQLRWRDHEMPYRAPFSRRMEPNARHRAIFLPGGYVSAVNDIDYFDADGAQQTLTGPTSQTPGTDYQEDLTDDEWPFLYPAAETDWPATDSGVVNAAIIDYQVGWANRAEVPASIRHAIRFKVADLYTIRDTADAGNKSALLNAAENLLEPYVVTLI